MKKIKLGDVAEYINGYAFKPTDWSENGYTIIRIQDLTGSDYQTNKFNGEIDSKYEVNNGDILISWSATLGIYVWNKGKAYLNQHIFKVVLNTEIVDKWYFYYQVDNLLKRAQSEAHGATMKHLTKEVFNNLPFLLPSLLEQKYIAKLLGRLDELIDKRKQQLENLDKLIKSQFIEMFGDPERNEMGWNIVPLSQIAEYFNGLTYRPEDRDDKGTIVLRSSNIQQGELDFSDIVRVQCRVKEKLFVKNGDILMCSRNGSANLVGKVAQIPQLSEPMTFGAFMMIIRSQVPEYLTTYFRLNTFRNQIKTGATTTINQITAAMLNKVRLPLPPRTITDKFARFVEQTDKSKFTIKQSLEQLEILKKSLMQKYFG